jgi:hypothetical protein
MNKSKIMITDEKKRELLWKAERAADDAKWTYNYAQNESDKYFRQKWQERSEFFLRLSAAYAKILKSIQNL